MRRDRQDQTPLATASESGFKGLCSETKGKP